VCCALVLSGNYGWIETGGNASVFYFSSFVLFRRSRWDWGSDRFVLFFCFVFIPPHISFSDGVNVMSISIWN
jgi:hypothetical protein